MHSRYCEKSKLQPLFSLLHGLLKNHAKLIDWLIASPKEVQQSNIKIKNLTFEIPIPGDAALVQCTHCTRICAALALIGQTFQMVKTFPQMLKRALIRVKLK